MLDLSNSALGAYLEGAEFVMDGAGTNVLTFTAKVKQDLTTDDVMEINAILMANGLNNNKTFVSNIGTLTNFRYTVYSLGGLSWNFAGEIK